MIRWKEIGKQLADWIVYPVRTNSIFFVYTWLVSILVMVVNNHTPDCAHTDAFLAILLPLFDCYLYCVIAAVLKPLYLHWLSWLAFTAITLGEIFCVLFYKSMYSINVMKLVMQTDKQESSEFIQNALHTSSPWLAFLFILLSALTAWGIIALCRKLHLKAQMIILYVMGALVIWSGIREVPQYIRLGRCLSEDTTADLGDSKHLPRLRSSSVRMLYGFSFNYVAAKELSMLSEMVNKNVVSSCSMRCPTIVLILGESYNKYHTPLYNPNSLPTTPYLCQMRDAGQLWVHSDAISPSNMTSTVMHNIFSTWDDQCPDHYTDHTLFPIVFRQAGYRVYYYSNQFVIEKADMWSMIGGSILNNPELSDLQFTARNTHRYEYDGELLQDIPNVDSLLQQPTLLIVHLQGQHVGYEERFPASFATFTEADFSIPYSDYANTIAARYANATRYNDSIVCTLWNELKDQDVIGIYLSDHGEEIFDWRDHYERSDMDELNKEIAKYQFEIPMLYLMTDTFQNRHPEVVEAVQSSLNKPFISSDLCQILFDLAGIDSPEYNAKHDILSPQYDNSRPRLIGRGVDYDELMKK